MAFNLNSWLRKTPQPVTVLADDKTITVPKSGRAWKDLTQTIEAMEPSKVTCLDGQGQVLRSHVLDSDDGKPAATPEMSDVQLFAKLIAEAYEKAARQYEPLINNAMEMVDRQGQRSAKQDLEIEKLRNAVHKLTAQLIELQAAPEPADDGSIVGALMAGMQAAQQGVPGTNVAPLKQAVKEGVKK